MAWSLKCSKDTNFKFKKATLTQSNVPDYNGFCTAESRIGGKPLLPETKILYQPYIDEPPTDPSTILTAMEDAEKLLTMQDRNILFSQQISSFMP